MLWLDKHHPELKIIPPYIRDRLNKGNEFGDSMMGIFGPYEEVKEYFPGTKRPNKKEMVRKTLELIDFGVKVICEAAFMDEQGNCSNAYPPYWPELKALFRPFLRS